MTLSSSGGCLPRPPPTVFPTASPHNLSAEALIREIPQQAAVSALSDYVPHLSAAARHSRFSPLWPGRITSCSIWTPPPTTGQCVSRCPRRWPAAARTAPRRQLAPGAIPGLGRVRGGAAGRRRAAAEEGVDTADNDAVLRSLLSAAYGPAGMPSEFVISDRDEATAGQRRCAQGHTRTGAS